jgi:hypothetical protein
VSSSSSPGTSALCGRVADERDIPGLLDLLAHAGWGAIDETIWKSWYRDGPYGPSHIIVAETSAGEIVGQVELRNARVRTPHGVVPALRVGSLVLAPSVRVLHARGLDHPYGAMSLAASEEARRLGAQLLYGVPHRAAILVAVRAGISRAATTFGCVALDLADVDDSSAGSEVHRVDTVTDEFDELWERARTNLRIEYAIERDASGVAKRGDNHELLVARTPGGRLSGYVRIRASDGLMTDMLAESWGSLAGVLMGAARHCRHEFAAGGEAPRRLTALAAPCLGDVLARAGFKPVRYDFGFFVVPLTNGLPVEVGDFSCWYLTGGD